ncbi:MAG: hypothetical protein IKA17_10315 [Clostridia bacterium]|nr:hypothetical protein [Clostridia bacterium]
MKTIFVVNPKAGSGKRFDLIMGKIEKLAQTRENVGYYITKKAHDAKKFVCEYCHTNGAARFIACGGDGTLSEILNGAIGYRNVEIGVVPIGSGNDFCRNFDSKESFFDLEKQISGACVDCDAIKYNTLISGEEKSGYCANMFNIGFDCAVADTTNVLKSKTFFSGSMAYLVSIFINLVKKKTSDLEIEIDGINRGRGELLLTSIANGCYCGGGLKTNPIALINDGLININIVKNVLRLKFLTLLPKYINGTCLGVRNIEKIISSIKCSRIKISPTDGKIRMSVDGEICDAGEVEFKIEHNAFKFVVPYLSNVSSENNIIQMV